MKKSIVVAGLAALVLLGTLFVYRKELLFVCTREVCGDMGPETGDAPKITLGPTRCRWPWEIELTAAERRKEEGAAKCGDAFVKQTER